MKRFFAFASKPYGGDPALARLPIAEASLPRAPLALVGRAIKPSATEIAANPRARSAVLRVEKIARESLHMQMPLPSRVQVVESAAATCGGDKPCAPPAAALSATVASGAAR